MKGTERGATMAPKLVPELKIPVAKARSFLGNHSAVALIAIGFYFMFKNEIIDAAKGVV